MTTYIWLLFIWLVAAPLWASLVAAYAVVGVLAAVSWLLVRAFERLTRKECNL